VSTTPADRGPERLFTPTSGTFSGWLGVGLAGVVFVVVALDDHTLRGSRIAIGALTFGLVVWCFMLRPRIRIGPRVLELRNPFTTWHVPLASVRRVAVRAVTRVWDDEERHFDGVAVGRPVRSLVRGGASKSRYVGPPGLGGARMNDDADSSRLPKGNLDADMVADFVTEQILLFADRAREAGDSPGTPRRRWAWLELVALGLLVVALVVSLLL
jgi:hypothetical protein